MQGLSRIRPARSDLSAKLYSTLLWVRPIQLSSLLKKCLLIRRRLVRTTAGHLFWVDPALSFEFQMSDMPGQTGVCRSGDIC